MRLPDVDTRRLMELMYKLICSLKFVADMVGVANTLGSLLLQLIIAKVLAESSFIFSPGSLHYADVYRHEPGRLHTLPFFLTFFIISSFQVFILY